MPKLEKDSVIAVVWSDIETDASWNTPEEIDKATTCECKTVGFFHALNGNNFIIKHSIADNNESDRTVIPAGCIKRIRILKMEEKLTAEIKKVKGKYQIYIK